MARKRKQAGEDPAKSERKPTLRLEWRSPAELADNPRNWRTHPPEQEAALQGAMTEVGWAGACLYNERTGRLIDGHLRRKVAQTQGSAAVPVLIGSWSEEDEAKILATLDPLAGMAGADAVVFDDLLKGIHTGCDDLRQLLDDTWDGIQAGAIDDAAGAAGDVEEDTPPEPQAAVVTRPGDLWTIGPHRLLCCDCRDPAAWERLLGGERAQMMFTDPPYGVNYEGGHFHSGDVNIKREREKLQADDSTAIYAEFLPVAMRFVDGPCYMWFAGSRGLDVYQAVHAAGCEIHALIIWHKINATYAAMNAQYKQRHEPCLYFKPKGSTLRWSGPTDECTLWEIAKDGRNDLHPTQKPVALAARAITNHQAETVVDVFAGSGSTIMACEHLGRRCFACEIEPAYVDVCLRRYVAKYPDADPVRHDGVKWSELQP